MGDKKYKDLIVSGSVRKSSSTGREYVMSKTFSINDVVNKVSRYVSFAVFKNKKDNSKRTIYVSESNKRFMKERESRGDGPDDAIFVSAKVTESESGIVYTRSETIDIEKVRRKFGTDYVFIMVVMPKNAKGKNARTIVIKPSSAKFMPGSRSKQSGQAYQGRYEQEDDDEIVI